MASKLISIFNKNLLIPAAGVTGLAATGGGGGYAVMNYFSDDKQEVIEEEEDSSWESELKAKDSPILAKYVIKERWGKSSCYKWFTEKDFSVPVQKKLEDKECNEFVEKIWDQREWEQPSNWMWVRKDHFEKIAREAVILDDFSLEYSRLNRRWRTILDFECTKDNHSKIENSLVVNCQKYPIRNWEKMGSRFEKIVEEVT